MISRKWQRTVTRFRTCRRGTALMEFTLLTPVMVSMIIAIVELGMIFLVSSSLENAVLTGSRYGVTGQTGDGTTREEKILDVINGNTFGLVNRDSIIVETTVYDSFSDIGKPEAFGDENDNGAYDEGEPYTDVNGNGIWDADVGTAGLGGAGDIVLYRVEYTIQSMTGLFEPIFGEIKHAATVAVRNEPY